ncbi:MAG: FAD binding domain-containing protein [Actinomycetota bacterium]
MIPAAFEYERAATIDDALGILADRGDEAKLLAGGHSLLPLMKLRLAQPALLVDIGRLDELRYIREEDDVIAIGALTRHADLERSDLLERWCPLLQAVAADIGDPQVRHRGTIGGSLSHADPASDLPAAVVALDAELRIRGVDGSTRTQPGTTFFTGLFETELSPTEMLTEVRVPKLRPGTGWSAIKFHRRAADWALVGVAALTHADGTARVALTNMGDRPIRATRVEQALSDGADAGTAATTAAEGTSPPSDISGSAEYRRALAEILVRRALEEASARANASSQA